jgi:hypothetical protein
MSRMAAVIFHYPCEPFGMHWPPDKCGKDESHNVSAGEDTGCQNRGGVCPTVDWERNNDEALCVDCEVCGISLAAESLQSHLETQHHIYRSFVLNRDLVPEQATVIYRATEPPATGIYLCLVPQCGGHSGTRFNLRRHFLMQHPQDLVCIPIEGSLPLPKCTRCGPQMPVEDLSRGHHHTGLCQRGWERKCQHEAAVRSKRTLDHMFSVNGEELERVEVFKYLGRRISHDDADNQAMWSNLRKARGCWTWVSRVLRAENATPKTCRMFYKATVQAVLLCVCVNSASTVLSLCHDEVSTHRPVLSAPLVAVINKD